MRFVAVDDGFECDNFIGCEKRRRLNVAMKEGGVVDINGVTHSIRLRRYMQTTRRYVPDVPIEQWPVEFTGEMNVRYVCTCGSNGETSWRAKTFESREARSRARGYAHLENAARSTALLLNLGVQPARETSDA